VPFCPTCRAEYRPGFNTCSECQVALVDELPPDPAAEGAVDINSVDWRHVYTGPLAVVEQVEAYLEASVIPFVRLPTQEGATDAEAGEDDALWTVAVPGEVYDHFGDRVSRAVHAGAVAGGDLRVETLDEDAEDANAVAEAEEDSSVFGCPECRFFFSGEYEVCPGCDVDLVPAVEIFEDGQLEPDRVIVADGDGPAVDALTVDLKAAGFDAESFEVEGWSVSAVDLPWGELCQRTGEANAVVAAHTAPAE
jgi:hypothetical protein